MQMHIASKSLTSLPAGRQMLADQLTSTCCRVPEECPVAIADLITRCMDSKPANRPSAKDVVFVLSEQVILSEQV